MGIFQRLFLLRCVRVLLFAVLVSVFIVFVFGCFGFTVVFFFAVSIGYNKI